MSTTPSQTPPSPTTTSSSGSSSSAAGGGKTYTALTDLPGTPVERCAQVLANKLQCWRPGDFLVSEGGPPPTAGAPSTQPAAGSPTATGAGGAPPSLQEQKQAQQTPATEPKGPPITSPPQAGQPLPGSQPQPSAGGSASTPPRTWQLCSMHKVIQERADKQGGDKALKAMLGVQLKNQQTPPEGKDLNTSETQSERDYKDMMAPENSERYKEFSSKRLPELEAEEPGASQEAQGAAAGTTPSSSPTSSPTQKQQGSGGQSKTTGN